MPHLQTLALLFLAGCASWTISTFSGGGGSVVLLATVTHLIRVTQSAPVVTLASLMASPARIIVSWRRVEWRIVRWYLPGAVMGAMFGGWLFSWARADWLTLIVGVFLVSTSSAVPSRQPSPFLSDAVARLYPGVGRRRRGLRIDRRQQPDLAAFLSKLRSQQRTADRDRISTFAFHPNCQDRDLCVLRGAQQSIAARRHYRRIRARYLPSTSPADGSTALRKRGFAGSPSC